MYLHLSQTYFTKYLNVKNDSKGIFDRNVYSRHLFNISTIRLYKCISYFIFQKVDGILCHLSVCFNFVFYINIFCNKSLEPKCPSKDQI